MTKGEKIVLEYRDTLNLPQTKFPMRGNLVKREPEILKFWEDINLYHLICQKNEGKSPFVLHDGPPYANGDIHVGHTLNKVLKDIVVKYKGMKGYFSSFVPGWDCHGQPIEHNVEKALAKEKTDFTQEELRKRCREYALDYVARQKEQFRRLGVVGDWENPYLTLDHHYEATNIKVFGKLYRRGLIYKKEKPIHWCYHCRTALAEAEIEYGDERSPSIYIKFPLKSNFPPLASYSQPKYFMVWTTTPWTLPANVAVALHPKAEYVAVDVGEEIYFLAHDLLESLSEELGLANHRILKEFQGEDLEGLTLTHPLFNSDSVTVGADFVLLDQGTGCVHIAPGHGQEDYLLGLEYNLPMPMPVDALGCFTEEAERFSGKHILKANPLIIDDLRERGLLIHSDTVEHSYPHCWRCHQPVIFRATEQWFVSMEKEKLRRIALDQINEVEWIPKWSRRRISSMVEERPDWCISRQRAWGVPLPIFYCTHCGAELLTPESIAAVIELFEKEGADAWFIKSAEAILPPNISCDHCGKSFFRKETDILDVWFESGISHEAVLKSRSELTWPADLYVEGSDQHRGWFQSSLLASVGAQGKAPYKAVLTHGFVVDEAGRKMSKSLGNVIDPLDVMKHSGADNLRLWVSSADFSKDVAISKEILNRISEAYRRIRNTARFLLSNLYDFNSEERNFLYEDLEEIDRWALLKLHQLIAQVTEAYEKYQFHVVFHRLYNFCVVDLSSFYLDVLKDRLYTSERNSKERKSAQKALYQILVNLVKMLAPILTFTAEEIWQSLPKQLEEEESVHLSVWPQVEEDFLDKPLTRKWERLQEVRDEVLKALEKARDKKIIGNSLEAWVKLNCASELRSFLEKNENLLPEIFIVSQVSFVESFANDSSKVYYESDRKDKLTVGIEKAQGRKCERCWKHSSSVGINTKHPSLCSRCRDVVSLQDTGFKDSRIQGFE